MQPQALAHYAWSSVTQSIFAAIPMLLRYMMCAVLCYGRAVFGLQVTLDSRSDAAQYVSTIPALELLTDDPSLAMRSSVTDEFSDNANEC
jgi:hypothetical protein